MGSKSNYRKSALSLGEALTHYELAAQLEQAAAAYELQVALGMRAAKKPTVVRHGWNLSQDQLTDMQDPDSQIVTLDPDHVAGDAADHQTPHSPESDSPPAVRLNPGVPIQVNPDNAARYPLVQIGPEQPYPIDPENAAQMAKTVLFSIIQDARVLHAMGIGV